MTRFSVQRSANGLGEVFKLYLGVWLDSNCDGKYTILEEIQPTKNEIFYNIDFEKQEDQVFVTLKGFPEELKKYMK
ncbi:hypothetical protein MIJ3_00188 [Pseudomonas phage vB_PaeM_MIJ3]|nr:hypothetical protein GBBBJNDB_00188 [Pseudomonas phage Callisto]WPK38824.1 hypothetical protein Cassandra_0148 [Pseudomonas phage Cassandra]WPK39345.1 hypothetical protein Deiofobo_0148 [Pseudomonas phage Deifobo]WPK39857.1 hypothetical protein ETTORE_0148 [Pseudomonas phage Ettore]WPK40378.1 hypothetical protein Paride_0148 [Pseudomonas phage Paride]VOH54738.1 hypothetical protein MIJ3_00188 [Pseudomonas phage vB_PaeM_MIJ3]